ncbi:MAG: hypothetical protein IPM20_00735 [Gammaproteobacteria bacterium]|nr:hypothetical protein [Gammaproteobacteria bacterium]
MNRVTVWTAACGALMLAGLCHAGGLDGQYAAIEEPSVTLTLSESQTGEVSGSFGEGVSVMPLSATRNGAGFTGTAGQGTNSVPLTAVMQGDALILEIGADGVGDRLTFRRLTDDMSEGTGSASQGAMAPAETGGRNVLINGKRLSDDELARLEAAYHIGIGDADYWYDAVLGAWGVRGGPTLGFIAPGLDLGGPLPADASDGETQIFVNGRELHLYDALALQRITGPIMPGRYFITAQGLAGFEGGAPLWNLAQLAARSNDNPSNSWQSRILGSSGFSDGTTSAVFLPNGGIVSTGE